MQFKGPLLWPASYKKSQDTKTAQLQVAKPILDDVNPNTNMVMMFLNSPLSQPKEYLGSVSNKSGILGRSIAISFVQTSVEKKY
jgi:hypothetical protein